MTTGYAGRAARAVGLAGAFAGLVIGLVASSASVRPVGAAVAAQKDKDVTKPPAGSKLELVGAARCKNCHEREDPKNVDEYKDTRGFDFIRLQENKVWAVHDLHRTAYTNLTTNRTTEETGAQPNATAQRMEDKLRKYKTHPKYADPKYTVASDAACLMCHASANEPPNKESLKTWTKDEFRPGDGVGCEMCHGHGSLYRDKHQDSRLNKAPGGPKSVVPWREWSPDVKKEWGLVNLRSHVEATNRCASCHIGNTDEGRFVTHDMYASGHPPLPPLDLLAYTREQPRHWGLPSEMPYLTALAEKNPEKAFATFHTRAGESHVARRFAESSLATLGATANLGAQLADDAKAKADGLDFAAFDCYSCHHNLKYPSERQDRGYVGRPGRPLYRPAAFALARLVLDHAAGMKGADLKTAVAELDAAELELADAFTAKTYGDPDKVKTATTNIAKWSEGVRKKLEAVRYTPEETKRLFELVRASATDEKKPVGDPEVAQLYTWAIETLFIELQPKEKTDKKEEPKALTEMRTKLDGTIVTRLRPNAAFYYEQGVTGGIPGPSVESVDSRLKARMDTFNSFRREPFRKALGEIKLP
ncbi:Uncharacterized protein OS=Singulisphaera acidiphila (strain ATCC BAA-1392 / DSM 18658 / VKM B-2454 / MOB10) GN=Sinac_4970 PE=4 SV=1: Cytochrome_C554 [Gemmata massiliana]|uniref:Cytochrome c-552/4 domain-containing protein n=1 Tax=Gemmata massiliana TaxID=1210884 RepID=A0A6P2CUQ2_9BACT|nr:multiheme c-type cytochrome [Gemmata massiliana]VTR92297.1 Uncharacterized protein OS=Singulisphaera acidiphila (strain ATCC BAA-1392 / DSM 18658 / VKM B-2454 / MOB10) GN=Sinac_4970 PE=4 SV=1: Cytochrome_C554 [Gemmata massiliana]